MLERPPVGAGNAIVLHEPDIFLRGLEIAVISSDIGNKPPGAAIIHAHGLLSALGPRDVDDHEVLARHAFDANTVVEHNIAIDPLGVAQGAPERGHYPLSVGHTFHSVFSRSNIFANPQNDAASLGVCESRIGLPEIVRETSASLLELQLLPFANSI